MPPIGNGVRLITNPGIVRGAIVATTARSGWGKPGSVLGFYSGPATVIANNSIADTSARPNGYEPPYAWQMAIKGGGLSAYNTIGSANTLTGACAMGINIASTMTSDGTIASPNLTLLIQILATLVSDGALAVDPDFPSNFAATLTSDGQLTATSLTLLIQITAELVSNGDLAGALATVAQLTAVMTAPGDITGNLGLTAALACTMVCANTLSPGLVMVAELAASLASEGQIAASLGVLAWLTAQLSNPGGLDGSNLRGTLSMSAELTSAGEAVTAATCAAAVWNALVANFQGAGSFGEALGSGGGGGGGGASAAQIWAAQLLANQTPGSFGEAVRKIFLTHGLDPLNPMVTDETSRRVPADGSLVNQTVITVGDETTVTTEDP